MHHPTLSLFRPSDHPPGGLQRRTPNRNCLYSVLLLRQGLLHKLSDHTEERYEIPKIFIFSESDAQQPLNIAAEKILKAHAACADN